MELGGKCPVIIDPRNRSEADYKLMARRILWGRNSNSGQTCTSPEYVLIPSESSSDVQSSGGSPQSWLVDALKEVYKEFYPDGAKASDSLAHIVNPTAAKRLDAYLDPVRTSTSSSSHTKSGHNHGHGKLVMGGSTDTVGRFVEPSIVCDVPTNSADKIMQEEMFGPLLCIVPVASFQEAIDYINAR
jgi:acyl-CoA reductase-like NAD-dependent aldehyde dehydrogenase